MVRDLPSRRKNRPGYLIERITVIPIGWVEGSILDFLITSLSEVFGKRVEKGSPTEKPHYAYDEKRRQYLAEAILLKLGQIRDSVRGRVLGVTEVGLYRQGGGAVFGHANGEKKVALVSIHRLQDEYYGLPGNIDRLKERVLKETIRQLGYTYGLKRCPNPLCAMFDSHQLLDLDIKRPSFCPRCKRAIP